MRRPDRDEQPRGMPDLSRFKKPSAHYFELHLEAVGQRGNVEKRVAVSWGLIARGRASIPFLQMMLSSKNPASREDAAGPSAGWRPQTTASSMSCFAYSAWKPKMNRETPSCSRSAASGIAGRYQLWRPNPQRETTRLRGIGHWSGSMKSNGRTATLPDSVRR